MNGQTTFADFLRTAREAAKITATELGRRIGKTQSYVSQLESGALHPPENDRLVEIASALGIEVDQLIIAAGRLPSRMMENALISARNNLPAFERTLEESASASVAHRNSLSRDPSKKGGSE